MYDRMNRVAFLIDGFNVYHSILEAQVALRRGVKWLDLRSLCQSYVRRSLFGRPSVLQSVTYFSAYATFLTSTNPGVVRRHRDYVRAIETTGVDVAMGRFKSRWRRCRACGKKSVSHEEKESDVAIAVRIIELAATRSCESIVVVSGDTDLLPALRSCRRLAPDLGVWVGAPFRRYSRELRQNADGGFKIGPQAYARHQLPDPVNRR